MPTKRKPEIARPTRSLRRLSASQQEERVKCLAAINRVRRGEARTVSAAARAEGTTIRAIRALVPKTINQNRPGGRIRVKPRDRYSAKVQILANDGALTTTAHGSRERELAGQHRATVRRVNEHVDESTDAGGTSKEWTAVAIFQGFFGPVSLSDTQFRTMVIDGYRYCCRIVCCTCDMMPVIDGLPFVLPLALLADGRCCPRSRSWDGCSARRHNSS
jgi:hypothetical protein